MSDNLLSSDALVARLRYMARQYTAGQYSRGGNPQGVHYLDQAANEITALRALLDQERAKVRELAESPPLASISLCCKIVRIGRWDDATMHDGGCYERNGRKLGPTYYLHDLSALLSGRGEDANDG